MSLLQFLKVGRSLSAEEQTPGAYRVRYGLPKFNADKPAKIFQSEKSKTQPIEAGEVLPRGNVTNEKQNSDARQREWLKQSGSKLFSAVMESCGAVVQKLPKLNVLARRRSGSPFGKSEKRTMPGTAQAELSLDKVKVLRNDLSDADLEVVPLGSARAGQRKPRLNPERAGSEQINFNQQVGELFHLQETQSH